MVPSALPLASGDSDGTIRTWNVADAAQPRPLSRIPTGIPVASVAFSPDSRTLASAGGNLIQLWNVAADPVVPPPLGKALTGGTGAVYSVTFSPDGHTLASGSTDGITRLWNLNARDAIERICVTTGGLRLRQWHDYIPQLPYQPLCAR